MGYMKILRGVFLSLCIYVFLNARFQSVRANPTNNGNLDNNHITRNRGMRLGPRTSYSRVRQEPAADFIVDDDDFFDLNKRQSDDYGHMRFGKRDFEDYGHMRFGRSGLN